MRGVFTCGVLDYLLDRQIYFSYAIGVSAGACNGLSYMSRQRGRARFSNIDMLEKYRYISWRNMWSQHSILDLRLLYKDFPERIVPYDMEAYRANPAEFEMVTTNCITGKACYLSERVSWDRLLRIARASSSLPYVCPVAFVDRQPMLDGGIVDSIPVLRAMEKGHGFNVVVLTRHRGYRKTERDLKIPRFFYRRFPRLRVVLSHRCECYNRQLELVERLEDEQRILVIRPEAEVKVDRMETDIRKLTDLYDEGYRCAERQLADVDIRMNNKVWNDR